VSGGVDDFLRKPLAVDELEGRMLAASRLMRAFRMVARYRRRGAAREFSVAKRPRTLEH
jgi:hypothetical protein